MIKYFLCVFSFFCAISCENGHSKSALPEIENVVNTRSYLYSNKYYEMSFIADNPDSMMFILKHLQSNKIVSGYAHLEKVDGEVPEGTNRTDYNNPNDRMGFKCDSTYSFHGADFSVYFAMESITKKRLDFGVYHSTDSVFKECSYTLLLK